MAEFLVLFAGCAGLLTCVIILIHYRKNKMVNVYLLLVLFHTSLYALLRSTHALGIQSEVDQNFLGIKRLAIFNFPLLYLFCRNVLFEPLKGRVLWLHAIFPLVFYGSVQVFERMALLDARTTTLFYLAFLACSLFYWVLSIRLWISHFSEVAFRKLFSGLRSLEEEWTFFILLIWTVLNIRILVIVFLDLAHVSSIDYENGFWLCTLLMIILFVRILASPRLIFGLGGPEKPSLGQQPSQSNFVLEIWKMEATSNFKNKQDEQLSVKVEESLGEKILKIEHEVIKNHFFRNTKSDLNLLSTRTKLPKSHLAYIFKYHSTLYFPDFKKCQQIRDAEQLIKEGYLFDNTLESLSRAVGFSSYNPFFMAFKKHTGIPPKKYMVYQRG